jgi:hypothetical protein
MKHIIAVLALVAALPALFFASDTYAFGGASPHGAAGQGSSAEELGIQKDGPYPIMGKVVETMDSGGYTYCLLENKGQKFWVAIPAAKVKVGEEVVLGPGQEMENFKSDTLKRTFDHIIFSSGKMALPGTSGDTGSKVKPKKGEKAIKVEKAGGSSAYTVAELYGKREKLNNKKVTVRGKVVKVSSHIMGKNWIHIQDGTGKAEDGTHNLVVTTADTATVGDTVTATGTLKKDKDFGYGYKYSVLLEDASISK